MMFHVGISSFSEKAVLEDQEMYELIKVFKNMHISISSEAEEPTAIVENCSRESKQRAFNPLSQ